MEHLGDDTRELRERPGLFHDPGDAEQARLALARGRREGGKEDDPYPRAGLDGEAGYREPFLGSILCQTQVDDREIIARGREERRYLADLPGGIHRVIEEA